MLPTSATAIRPIRDLFEIEDMDISPDTVCGEAAQGHAARAISRGARCVCFLAEARLFDCRHVSRMYPVRGAFVRQHPYRGFRYTAIHMSRSF
ncbi:hypothetical protein D3C86_1730770 [compost metagenome]